MRRQTAIGSLCCVWTVFATQAPAQAPPSAASHWPQWRGPSATGVAPEAKPPVEWSADKNIRWKVELPGEGQSTPIVWGDLVYIQCAVPVGEKKADSAAPSGAADAPRGRGPRSQAPSQEHEFTIMAFERKTGKKAWSRVVRKELPHEGNHKDGSLAPASPLTDGEHLFAYFGSRGLYALDMQGKPLWDKDLGDMKTRNGFGEGSTPVLYKNTIVVPWDQEGGSFIVALDKATGAERWRKDRDEPTSWATPLIVRDGDREIVVASGTKRVRGYDLANGDLVWECAGLGANCIPSPVADSQMVYAMSGYSEPALVAIKYVGAKGDVSKSDSVAWRLDKATPYVPSPLLYDGTLYFLQKNTNLLSCYDAKTGKPNYPQQRLEGIDGVYASPLGADGRVYIVGRNGSTVVLARAPEFKVLAVNKLDDDFSASPAAAGSELYLRGKKHLYCIAAE